MWSPRYGSTSCAIPIAVIVPPEGVKALKGVDSGSLGLLMGLVALPGTYAAARAAPWSTSSTAKRLKLATVAASKACRRVLRRPR